MFLKHLQSNLPNSVREDSKFRQTAHSIATALDSLSSAVSTGLKNSGNILANDALGKTVKRTVDLKFEIPALLSRYQMLRDVRIELQLYRSIPTNVEIDAETLTVVLSGCISHMLQSVLPQGAINIAAHAVIVDSEPDSLLRGKFTRRIRRACTFSQNLPNLGSVPGSELIFTLTLGTPAQSGKPYRKLGSHHKESIAQRQGNSSLNFLHGLVQHGLRGEMGAVVDVALSSAPTIGVWFSILAENSLPTAEPGFDIAVINSAVRSGTASQGLSVVAEEASNDANADVDLDPPDEVVFLCHTAEQRNAWSRQCHPHFRMVNIPCNTPASFPTQWREYRHQLADVKAILLSVGVHDIEHATQAVAAARASGWLPSIVGVVQAGEVSASTKLPGLTGVIEFEQMCEQLEWFIDGMRRSSTGKSTSHSDTATSTSNSVGTGADGSNASYPHDLVSTTQP
jgi:hypothetical protein